MIRILGALGALLGWIAGSVLRIRRAHVEASMAAAGIERPAARARAMYRALGISAAEFVWLAVRGSRALQHVRIEPQSLVRWRAALSRGRGVVVAASHTGNWDLSACAVSRDVELLVITKYLRVGWLDRFWQSTRSAQGVTLAGAHGAMWRSRETLRRGGAVAMMIDQVPTSTRHAVAVEFLGRPALADRSPAALAASARAPLVVAAGCRGRYGEQVLHVLEVLWPPARPTRAWIESATSAATIALDRFVRAHPDQWLWLHRRWKLLDPLPSGAMLARSCSIPSSSAAIRSRVA